MNFTKKSTFTGILLLCYFILCNSSVQAQVMTQQLPREKLLIRLNRIGTLYNKNIVFDTKQVANIEVPALNINSFTIEQTLNATLQITGLSYKKTAEQSYLIEKKTETKPQHSSLDATLKGRIVESETSEPIPGAAIRLSDKQYAVTDMNGYYAFPKVPAGKLVLEVSYVGFKHEKAEINVKSGENTYDIKMSSSTTLGEVQVSTVRRTRSAVPHTTEKLLVAEIKGLSVLASGISSEQISKSADRNAAEAVQRVSGVSIVDDKFVVVRGLNQRYSLTYLNDNVAPSTELYSRAFALDLIPSRIIDKILVYKSTSADNLADATGGVVKIYTKDAKNVKHFDIELQTGYREGTTFNNNFLTYNGGKTDFLGFDDGTRALPSSVPGYGSLSIAKISQSEYAKSFSPVLTYGSKSALPNRQLTANYYNAFPLFNKNKYLSSLTSFSYKNERNHSDVYRQQGHGNDFYSSDRVFFDNKNVETAQLNLLQNFSYSLRDSSKIEFKNFLLEQGTSTTIVRTSHLNRDEGSYYSRDKDNILLYNQRFLYAGNLGGTHYFDKGRHQIQWNGGYVYNMQTSPDQRVIRFTSLTDNVSVGDPNLAWIARGRYSTDADLGDPRLVELGIISRVWTRLSESTYNASVDYTFKFKPWGSFKAGTFQLWRERRYDRRVYTVNEGDLKGKYSDYVTAPGGYGLYMDPNIVRFNEQELPAVWSGNYLREDLSGLKVIDRTTGTDSYVGTEQNNSGYVLMNLAPFNGKLEINGGLRLEYNRQKIGGALPRDYTSPVSINTPILIDNATKHWLPSVNATCKPVDNWVLRAAYGETVNRFEFREAAPYSELDYENNQTISGNPYLKTTTVRNYDFRAEFYPKGNQGEIASVGLFYKDLKDPIERITFSSRVQNMFPVITYINAKSATIKGIEFELRKKLDFVPLGLFRNLSLIANLTLIESNAIRDSAYINRQDNNNEAKATSGVNGITYKRQLQGQAPYILNAGLYYDNAGTGTKVSVMYNVVGTSIYAAGMPYLRYKSDLTFENRGAIFKLSRNLVDISVTQRIIKSLQMKLTVQNLLDEEVRMAEDYNFTDKYEPEKTVTDAGGGTKKEGDPISSRYKPGRYFQFTLSYSF